MTVQYCLEKFSFENDFKTLLKIKLKFSTYAVIALFFEIFYLNHYLCMNSYYHFLFVLFPLILKKFEKIHEIGLFIFFTSLLKNHPLLLIM